MIFSAHGVAKTVPEEASARNLFTIDATCPLVTKVHREAQAHFKRGRRIVLIGHVGHPEVIGTMGQLPPGAVTLVSSIAEVDALPAGEGAGVAYVTQTTLSVDDTREIVAALKRRFPAIHAAPLEDICYATTNRQEAVKAAARQVEAVIRGRGRQFLHFRSGLAGARSPRGRAARPSSLPTPARSTGRRWRAWARSRSPPAPRRPRR